MTKNFLLFALVLFVITCLLTPANAQKYKTAADSVKLNKEYAKVIQEIADLNARITQTQNDLPSYEAKANTQNAQAQLAATESSEQANRAQNGDLKTIKKAKKKAKKALDEANDAKSAQNKVQSQNKKLEKLNKELAKKQKRLQELETMRTNISSNPSS